MQTSFREARLSETSFPGINPLRNRGVGVINWGRAPRWVVVVAWVVFIVVVLNIGILIALVPECESIIPRRSPDISISE